MRRRTVTDVFHVLRGVVPDQQQLELRYHRSRGAGAGIAAALALLDARTDCVRALITGDRSPPNRPRIFHR